MDHLMQNLARNPMDFEVNRIVLDELYKAKIPIKARNLTISVVEGSQTYYYDTLIPTLTISKKEVPTNYYGKIQWILFERAWSYWVVSNLKMPLETAWKIFNEPISNCIRAFGHCGCVEPTWNNNQYVDCYHVDSQEGLNLLVKYIKELIV